MGGKRDRAFGIRHILGRWLDPRLTSTIAHPSSLLQVTCCRYIHQLFLVTPLTPRTIATYRHVSAAAQQPPNTKLMPEVAHIMPDLGDDDILEQVACYCRKNNPPQSSSPPKVVQNHRIWEVNTWLPLIHELPKL